MGLAYVQIGLGGMEKNRAGEQLVAVGAVGALGIAVLIVMAIAGRMHIIQTTSA